MSGNVRVKRSEVTRVNGLIMSAVSCTLTVSERGPIVKKLKRMVRLYTRPRQAENRLKMMFCLRKKTSMSVDVMAHNVPAEREIQETRRMSCFVEMYPVSRDCSVITIMRARRRSVAAAKLTSIVVEVTEKSFST